MKKGLSYDEEMTLLLELAGNMDESGRKAFTQEEAQRMVEDQRTYERSHGFPMGEYDAQLWYDTIMEIIAQEAEEEDRT